MCRRSRRLTGYYRALPPDRFPCLSERVDALVADDGESRFRYGLELLLDGIEARMPKGAGPP
ncbi:TetR/AcrR family transcriptional regulator C-terminal domain-containing protein [Nonomuraea antimicrobica]|uniref:TetR/AcrR family transcriptional regulator C-terminal domain-containing protein n=1 Tax=Nonomuraea antimicrobica TaxID=561173 RepID=UPI0031ED5E9D